MNQAKGSFDGPSRASVIGANDQLLTSRDYKPIIVAYKNGGPVHVSDVADVVDGAENVQQAAWMNQVPAVILNIQRQPGANVIEVVDRIKRLLPQLQASLPPAVQVAVLSDRTTTIRASVEDVQFELLLGDRAGRDGDLSLPAHPGGDGHPGRGGAALTRRHLRRHVAPRVQPQQPVARWRSRSRPDSSSTTPSS